MPDREDQDEPVDVPVKPRLEGPPKVPTASAEPEEVDAEPRLGPGAKVRYGNRNAPAAKRRPPLTGRKK